MEEYESSYEEYKKSILQNRWFIDKLRDKYRGSLTAAKDYIDENGVLWKTGLLGAVCGFLIAFTPIENENWILGIVLFMGVMGSLIWARHIDVKFKKDLGEKIFYAFRYHKHFKDRVQEDRTHEAERLNIELSKHIDFLRFCVDTMTDKKRDDVEDNFKHALQLFEDIEAQYRRLEGYDRFAQSLKNDYEFNAEVKKRIDQ